MLLINAEAIGRSAVNTPIIGVIESWRELSKLKGTYLDTLPGIADPKTDLFARTPHGDGQTILREALLVADHTAYHLGQLLVIRRALGAWR